MNKPGISHRLRSALAVLMGTASLAAIAADGAAALTPPPANPMKVSRAAIERALSQPVGPERAQAFASLFPMPAMPDWIPPGEARQKTELAFDSQVSNVYGFASQGFFGEGIGFLGYPYLAELSQRPEYRQISVIRAQEMTRKWIRLTYSGQKNKAATEKLAKLKEAMDRWQIQDLFRKATEHDNLFGRGQIYIDTGATDKPEELARPLVADPRKIGRGNSASPTRLRGFRVVEPMWTYPGPWNGM